MDQTNLLKKGKCLKAEQFDLPTLYELCELTDKIRERCKTKKGCDYLATLLSDKRAMLYFKQPSTRTFLSFQNACYLLGIKCSEIRDTSTSSEVKGETEEDAVRVFAQYVDLIIMRHPSTDFIHEVSLLVNGNKKLINAGSGTDEHPTQALLDFYTIYKYGLNNKKIGFIGDLNRGRTVRSLALLLNLIPDLKLYFIAPESFQIKDDIINKLKVKYEKTDDTSIIKDLDVIYMTRLQKEYGGISDTLDIDKYSINKNNIKELKDKAIIMHPLPRNHELSTDIDKDKRAKYFEQAENGMWVRAALLTMIFNVKDKI